MLAPFETTSLDDDPATICAVTAELRIAYVNRAWARFAQDNGARWRAGEWGVGSRILDAIPEVLRPFYDGLFAAALGRREIVEHEYDCSSVSVERRFRMRVLPCGQDAALIVHSPLRVVVRDSPANAASQLDSLYRDGDGLVVQCSHCRRVRRARSRDSWDWVPAYVERTAPLTSHGLCVVCFDYYYPEF